jgi:hypothetical protein
MERVLDRMGRGDRLIGPVRLRRGGGARPYAWSFADGEIAHAHTVAALEQRGLVARRPAAGGDTHEVVLAGGGP